MGWSAASLVTSANNKVRVSFLGCPLVTAEIFLEVWLVMHSLISLFRRFVMLARCAVYVAVYKLPSSWIAHLFAYIQRPFPTTYTIHSFDFLVLHSVNPVHNSGHSLHWMICVGGPHGPLCMHGRRVLRMRGVKRTIRRSRHRASVIKVFLLIALIEIYLWRHAVGCALIP